MEPAPAPTQRLPRQAWLLFALQSLGWAAPVAIGAFFAGNALDGWEGHGWTGVAVRVLGAAIVLYALLVEPRLRWRNWRYELRDEEIDLSRGVFAVTRTLIPTIRVQHVETQRTWLSDQLGVRSVIVHTAGGANRIPALRPDDATAIRDRIAQLARRPDDG